MINFKKRTNEELVEYTKKLLDERNDDILGAHDLISFMDFDHAKQFLSENENQKPSSMTIGEKCFIKLFHPRPLPLLKNWDEIKVDYTEEAIICNIKFYLAHGCDVAKLKKGFSVYIAINHLKNLIWASGDDDLYKIICNEDDYDENCGLTLLEKIKEKLE